MSEMLSLEEKVDMIVDAQRERSKTIEKLERILVGENGDSGLVQEVREMRTYVKVATWIFGIIGSTFVIFVVTTILEASRK